jgi:pimeloyl-ACP methyl ester carboxylesterase
MKQPIFPEVWYEAYQWKGMELKYIKAPSKQIGVGKNSVNVVLIHGFGACKEHWRNNVTKLQEFSTVYAIDLVGFGDSSKPRSRLAMEPEDGKSWRYGIESWGMQIHDFILNNIEGSVHLIGNSIGGVVALEAARLLEQSNSPAAQVILIDCAERALDDKRLAEQPPLRKWGRPLLKAVLKQRWFTRTLYSAIAKPGVIRKVLGQAYPTGSYVDDELIELLLKPALQPGADEAFRGFVNLFEDLLAPDLLARLITPVSIVWGEKDPWEPIETALLWKGYPCVRSFTKLPGLGHCPHDEGPELVNGILANLIEGVKESC